MNEITQFYNTIETEYKVFSYHPKFPDYENLTEEQRLWLSYEYMSTLNFEANIFKERVIKEKEQICKYLLERINSTSNFHLLGRYYHLLLFCTGNNKYISNTIKHYKDALEYYLSNNEEEYNTLYYSKVLEVILKLSLKYKYDIKELKRRILLTINNKALSPKIKTFVFEKIKDSKLFKTSEQTDFPQICTDLSIQKSDFNIRARLLKLAIIYSRKTLNTLIFKKANELLGDLESENIKPYDDKNIILAHQNENTYSNMIAYYKHAGNKEKQKLAIKALEENKKQLKYIKFESKVPLTDPQELNIEIDKLIKTILDSPIEKFLFDLCFNGNNIPFIPYKKIKESIKEQMKKTTFHQLFKSVQVDVNNNKKEIPYDIMSEHHFFQVSLNNFTLPLTICIISQLTKQKKLTYRALKSFLNKTSFGEKLTINIREEPFQYSWFSQIDIGLKELLKQFRRIINNRKTDWSLTIDTLVPKFEGILRDIVSLKGGEITNIKDNGDSSLKSLDELLRSSVLEEIFNEDDLFLFRHTFTRVGLNIRNDVAHGILKPFDYNVHKATLVLICILRLNKFSCQFT